MTGFLGKRAKAVYVLLSRKNKDWNNMLCPFMLVCGEGGGRGCCMG